MSVAVTAIDPVGVLGSRISSPMWGPLVQCETLLRNNGVVVVLGESGAAPSANIYLTSVPSEPAEALTRPLLVIDYSAKEGRPSLADGRPRLMQLIDRRISLSNRDVVGAISLFIRELDEQAGPAAFALSIEIEVLVGQVSTLLYQLEAAQASLGAALDENRILRQVMDELTAERDLLRTQIAQPSLRKVHWTTRSLLLSLITISTLIQGSAALRELADRLSAPSMSPTIVIENLHEAVKQCTVIVEDTAEDTAVEHDGS